MAPPRASQPPDDQPSRRRPTSRRGGPGSPDESSASTSPNPLGFEGAAAFEGGRDRPPVADAASLETDEHAPPPPKPIEWDADKLGAVLRGGFALVRFGDPVARQPEGRYVELWMIDRAEAAEIAEPLARIANRYTPLRTLAGFSDEAEVGATLLPVVFEHLRRRGEAISLIEQRIAGGLDLSARFEGEKPMQPATEPVREPDYPDGEATLGAGGAMVFPPPPEAE